MPRGGKREGAGRHEGSAKPTATASVSARLPLALRDRVEALRLTRGYTLPEIVRAGVEALESRA